MMPVFGICHAFRRNLAVLLALITLTSPLLAQATPPRLEMSRPVRSWEFLPVVGQHAGLFGDEKGRFEGWVYPIKLFRDFHLTFHVEGRALPGESLARTLIVHPEAASILYASDTFSVQETLFVPVDQQGAVIVIDVQTEQPLEVEATFVPDFQLEWPAALGGTFLYWDASEHAFVLGEEQKKFAAVIGSPTATEPRVGYQTNYSASEESGLRLGVTAKGKDRKVIVLAASTDGLAAATETYQRLVSSHAELLQKSSEYFRTYLDRTVQLELPDPQLQEAYDWSRVSTVQGLVTNPFLGTGLVAGYRTSGTSQRPGFAWFFGRDSLWTSLALNAEGDFATTRTALEFISKFQREDGKMPHEISQGANFVPWFKDYPYGYASADATPLYIIAMNDYAVQSGDAAFVVEKWDSLWRAYQFLQSTYDERGFPKNFGVGHGWVEGGPLLPVKTEYYQSGLAVEALRALSNLAKLTGKGDVSAELSRAFDRQLPALDKAFWSSDRNIYAFALDNQGKQVEEASVLTTVPMWFGLADQDNAQRMISQLATAEHQTDWGMRIISSASPHYGAGGYHFGSVWPLFTGWASVGEYRYHRSLPAYLNLRSNALLASDGSLGHVTEVLSGDYYQGLSTSSPHQIWSAAMVISPMLRGMLGLMTHAQECNVTLAPHVPAGWSHFAVTNIHAGAAIVDVRYMRSAEEVTLEVQRKGGGECSLDFSPALGLRAQVTGVDVNGRKLSSRIEKNTVDQHLSVHVPLASGSSTVKIRVKNDFGLDIESQMPSLGTASHGLRAIGESWDNSRKTMTAEFEGVPGRDYDVVVWNPQQVTAVEGGVLSRKEQPVGNLRITIPPGTEPFAHLTVTFHFAGT